MISHRPVQLALAVDMALIALHLGNAIPLPPLPRQTAFLDLAAESNLPTWWSGVQLWTAGLLLVGAGWRRGKDAGILGIGFLVLACSMDEVARMHERIAFATRSEALPVTGIWPLIFVPLAIVVGVAALLVGRQTWRRDPVAAAWLLGGAAALVGFSAGVEMFANVIVGMESAIFLQALVEETGEMLAGTLMLAGAYRVATSPHQPAGV